MKVRSTSTRDHSSNAAKGRRPYVMRISRLTIDKLGVKLYDKASAVVAELIANGYDADAETVTVKLPLNSALAVKHSDKSIHDAGYDIVVQDDGHGMTPDEVIDHYLQVGRDRRQHSEQGARSREKKRPVMGRKGIGKLAPFGICKCIEVISAGGKLTAEGYQVAHFTMNFDAIVSDTDNDVTFTPGVLDRSYSPQHGTTIKLCSFLPKRVPDDETFHRQLAARFVFAEPNFAIYVEDNKREDAVSKFPVEPLNVPINEETKINLDDRPVVLED